VNYYDGQGFMVRKSADKDSALELDNSKVCVQSGTTRNSTSATTSAP